MIPYQHNIILVAILDFKSALLYVECHLRNIQAQFPFLWNSGYREIDLEIDSNVKLHRTSSGLTLEGDSGEEVAL